MKTTLFTKLGMMALTLGWDPSPAHAQDTTPPFLVSAASLGGTNVSLCFSEPMDRSDLDDFFTYFVGDEFGAVGYDDVSIRPGDSAVVLHVNSAVASPFLVYVTGSLRDRAGNPLPFGASVTGTVWSAEWAWRTWALRENRRRLRDFGRS